MKNLTNYLYEGISQNLKDQLLALINSNDLDPKTAMQMINTGKYSGKLGFNTGKQEEVEVPDVYTRGAHKGEQKVVSTGRGKNKVFTSLTKKIIQDKYEEDAFGYSEWMNKINISESKKEQIAHILMDANMFDRYIKYIEKPWFDTKILINGEQATNIFKLLGKTKINDKTLKSIAMLEDTIGNINQGKYEILCKMFLNDLSPNNKDYDSNHHGDVQAGGYAIEFKGETARVGGQHNHPSERIYTKLQEILNDEGKNYKVQKNSFNSEKRINETVDELYKLYDNNDLAVFNVIFDAMYAQFEGVTDNNPTVNRELLCKNVLNNGKVVKKDGENAVTRLMMAIQLHFYQLEEGFNYLFLVNPNTGDYICINEDKFDIENLFFNTNIGVVTGVGGKCTGAARDNYCQINYKK